jgi:hypothetical protein
VLLALLLPRVAGAVALVLALTLWLALGLLFYVIAVRAGWLRTRANDKDQGTPREQQEQPGMEHAGASPQGR